MMDHSRHLKYFRQQCFFYLFKKSWFWISKELYLVSNTRWDAVKLDLKKSRPWRRIEGAGPVLGPEANILNFKGGWLGNKAYSQINEVRNYLHRLCVKMPGIYDISCDSSFPDIMCNLSESLDCQFLIAYYSFFTLVEPTVKGFLARNASPLKYNHTGKGMPNTIAKPPRSELAPPRPSLSNIWAPKSGKANPRRQRNI